MRKIPKKKKPEEFRREFNDLVGEEYSLLSEYELSSKHVEIKHNICGHKYKIRPNAFLKGCRCPNCNGNKSKQKTTEQFKKEVYDLVGEEYKVLGEYKTRSTKIKIKHTKCGREYYVEPGNFLYKSRCIECHYESVRIQKEEIDTRVKDILGRDYKVIEYNGVGQKKSVMKHYKCNKTFEVRLDDVFHRKSGCPYCSQSRGEDYVESYLKNRNIKYIQQKKFDDLMSCRQLSYDFYLPDYNILIEYQGEQHFNPKNFGGVSKEISIERLKKQKIHDKIKRKYAKEKGYVLLEPTYKLDSLEKVEKYLNTKFTLLEVTQGVV